MDRLTDRDENGKCYIKNLPPFYVPQEANKLLQAVVNKLAAYEDKGIEPEDMLSALDLAKIACALQKLVAYEEAEMQSQMWGGQTNG